MSNTKTPPQTVREHWAAASTAPLDEQGLKPTARDPYLQQAVETAIMRRLPLCGDLLDIGCGDGSSTRLFSTRAQRTLGVDFVDGFVARAKEEHGRPALDFMQADVLELGQTVGQHKTFDVAVSIRCLINLPDFERQALALGQIAGVLKSGGLYLTSEGWLEGFEGLNERRRHHGLPEMKVATYNQLICRKKFECHVARDFEIVGYESLGYYLFMSRVFQPLLVQPEAPTHTHRANHVAMQTQELMYDSREFMDCDYAGVYVLRRK